MKEYSGPMRFAHRGVAQKAPENTEGAFQAAVDEGYEGIELDTGIDLTDLRGDSSSAVYMRIAA